jgi:protein-S-isoprenylcysteine O-methyltransferase Ste14
MLSLLVVQVLSALGILTVLVGRVVAGPAGARRTGPVRVVAAPAPARGTHALWIAGSVVSTFWGFGVFLVPAYAYHWPAFPDFAGSSIVQGAGVSLAVAGGVLFYFAAREMGAQMTPVIRVEEGHRLRTTGPYRRIRHPVYTAILSVATGETIFFLSVPLGVLTLALVALANYRARLEERLLSSPQAFDGEYLAFMARTGRFLPRWGVPK